MCGKFIHKRRDIIQISFPNNRRSTRFPRKRAVARRVWKEEESSAYFGVPASALFTPYDVPNPTDNAPTLVDYHTIHYSDAGGYAPAQPCPEFLGEFGGLGQPGLNASEYLSNQFNPFVKENIPPVITNVIWDTETSWKWGFCEHAWVEIDAYILDVAPYSGWIGVTDRNTYIEFSGTGGQYAQIHHAVIDLDYWGDVIAEYYINVTVWDNASNYAYYEKEVAGILGSFTNFLGDVWNAVCGVFAAAWEAVKAACSFLVDIIVGIANRIISGFIEMINSALENVYNSVILTLSEISEAYTISKEGGTAFDHKKYSTMLYESSLGRILSLIMGVFGAFFIIYGLITAMSGGLASIIFSIVISTIVQTLVAEVSEKSLGFNILSPMAFFGLVETLLFSSTSNINSEQIYQANQEENKDASYEGVLVYLSY